MSMQRMCPNCYKKEGIRMNFGQNRKAEIDFHDQHWCNCGYTSPEEMIQDQELGFSDPRWVRISKYFLNEYYFRINQGVITNKDEHFRFFMKLLKNSINNVGLSVELVSKKEDEEWELIYDGKYEKEPQVNIFDGSSDLEKIPTVVILDSDDNNLIDKINQSQKIIEEFEAKNNKKNKLIFGLIVLLLVVGITAIVF